jgi:DNA-binding transcriptional MerR regulator
MAMRALPVVDADPRERKFVKLGRLAQLAGVFPSTIRHYMRLGLIGADAQTPGGYGLFDPERALPRLRRIQDLQSQRFRLDEIASILVGENGVGAG